jgi:SlyX protein
LQEVAVSQAKEIELLRKENKLIREKLLDMIDSMDTDIPNRKPPHY